MLSPLGIASEGTPLVNTPRKVPQLYSTPIANEAMIKTSIAPMVCAKPRLLTRLSGRIKLLRDNSRNSLSCSASSAQIANTCA